MSETVLKLSNGNEIRSDSENHVAGDYVRVVDAGGEELGYWSCAEWAEEPEAVMGAILLRAQEVASPQDPLDRLVEVCDQCFRVACLRGEHMCDSSVGAGITTKMVRELKELKREHPLYWLKEETGNPLSEALAEITRPSENRSLDLCVELMKHVAFSSHTDQLKPSEVRGHLEVLFPHDVVTAAYEQMRGET